MVTSALTLLRTSEFYVKLRFELAFPAYRAIDGPTVPFKTCSEFGCNHNETDIPFRTVSSGKVVENISRFDFDSLESVFEMDILRREDDPTGG